MEAAGPPGLYPPGQGDKIGNILAEEQEVVGKGNQREQIVGEAKYRVRQVPHIKKNQSQINKGKNPGLHRDDKEEQEVGRFSQVTMPV
jgi:hypothetical protein